MLEPNPDAATEADIKFEDIKEAVVAVVAVVAEVAVVANVAVAALPVVF